MRTVAFERRDGTVVERMYELDEDVPRRIRCDDGKFARRTFRVNMPAKNPALEKWRKGLVMTSCGCHPSQVARDKAQLERRLGHPVEYRDDSPVAHSDSEKRAIAKVFGFVDHDGNH